MYILRAGNQETPLEEYFSYDFSVMKKSNVSVSNVLK